MENDVQRQTLSLVRWHLGNRTRLLHIRDLLDLASVTVRTQTSNGEVSSQISSWMKQRSNAACLHRGYSAAPRARMRVHVYGIFGISIVSPEIDADGPATNWSLTRSLPVSTVAFVTLIALCPVFTRRSGVYFPGGMPANSKEPSERIGAEIPSMSSGWRQHN